MKLTTHLHVVPRSRMLELYFHSPTCLYGIVLLSAEGYINTQNNHYWSSQNPYLTHEVQLHPLKVGVWCAVSARRIVGPVFFLTKQLIARDMYR
jgi:hypothetical protein